MKDGAENVFLHLANTASVNQEAFVNLLKEIEKNSLPLEVRAEEKVISMHRKLHLMCKPRVDRFFTIEEWDVIRKYARQGMRLAKRFGFNCQDKNHYVWFKTLHDTAAHRIANM